MKTITIRVHLSDEELVTLEQLAEWHNEWARENMPDCGPLAAEAWLSASLNGMLRREHAEMQQCHGARREP